jgi:hypothetical protein
MKFPPRTSQPRTSRPSRRGGRRRGAPARNLPDRRQFGAAPARGVAAERACARRRQLASDRLLSPRATRGGRDGEPEHELLPRRRGGFPGRPGLRARVVRRRGASCGHDRPSPGIPASRTGQPGPGRPSTIASKLTRSSRFPWRPVALAGLLAIRDRYTCPATAGIPRSACAGVASHQYSGQQLRRRLQVDGPVHHGCSKPASFQPLTARERRLAPSGRRQEGRWNRDRLQ